MFFILCTFTMLLSKRQRKLEFLKGTILKYGVCFVNQSSSIFAFSSVHHFLLRRKFRYYTPFIKLIQMHTWNKISIWSFLYFRNYFWKNTSWSMFHKISHFSCVSIFYNGFVPNIRMFYLGMISYCILFRFFLREKGQPEIKYLS